MGQLLKALAAAALAFACSGQDSTELVAPPLTLEHSFGANYYDTHGSVPEGLDEHPPPAPATEHRDATPEEAEAEAKRLGKTVKQLKQLGKLEQALIAQDGHGFDAQANHGCFIGETDRCVYPDDPSLVIRVCWPGGVHQDWISAMEFGIWEFQQYAMNALASYSEFSAVVDWDNCTDPEDPGVVFLTVGETVGGDNVFGQQNVGTFLWLPWQHVKYFERNTITIDLNNLINAGIASGKSGVQMTTATTNVVFHELLHAVGLDHTFELNQVGVSQGGPYLMRAFNSHQWDYLATIDPNQISMLNNFQR